MTAYQSAINDIKDDLKSLNKCFLSFRKELNPIMKDIVDNAIKKQKNHYD